MMDITNLLPADLHIYKKQWKCEIADHPISDYWKFCDLCDKEKNRLDLLAKCRKLDLATIEGYFGRKYGESFSIDDYHVENQGQAEAKSKVSEYIEIAKKMKDGEWIEEKGLILYGKQGTGKNMLSNIVQYELIKAGLRTHRDTQFNIYNKILKDEATIRSYLQYDVLFVDEIGRISNTEPSRNTFFELMDTFKSKNKQIVLTTNLKEGMKDFIDLERLKEYMVIPFTWESSRGKK